MCNVYGEECFSQKMFVNGVNMGFPLEAQIKKTIYGVETYWLSSKGVPSTRVSKEGLADSLLGHERTHHYWFHWKRYICKQYFILPKFTLFIEWPIYNQNRYS